MKKISNTVLQCEYIGSQLNLKDLPSTRLPEFAFIGRSNVGKSSLINMLTRLKKLAKVSNTPGKTRLINHFIINKKFYLVDLPGYGFAKISKATRNQWKKLLSDYLSKRTNLQLVFVLVDVRLSPQKADLDFINWLGKLHIPFNIVYTKSDKQGKTRTQSNIHKFHKALAETWDPLPGEFVTSAKTGLGRDELLGNILDLVEKYK